MNGLALGTIFLDVLCRYSVPFLLIFMATTPRGVNRIIPVRLVKVNQVMDGA
jgi:hypothetical protein